jgi:DNA-binding XRE family transcriptional regulator
MSVWEYESEEQKTKMDEKITLENCGEKLRLIREVSGMSRRELAEVLGCSESTVFRIEAKKTFATNDFIDRLRGLSTVGYYKFSKMTEAEKGVIGEAIGTAGGAATGVGASIAAVSAAGSVGGLSAAGITSGLAAIGGGTMLGGIATIAAIPIAVGLAGWGLVKGIKAICAANNLSCEEVNDYFEIVSGASIAEKDEKSKESD